MQLKLQAINLIVKMFEAVNSVVKGMPFLSENDLNM
jgi:hypothetical protein